MRSTEVLSAGEMRAAERTAIAAGETTGGILMERAGSAVVAAILERWPELAYVRARAAVLCGPGNNGGDGYVIARLLRARGWSVRTIGMGDPADLPPDARANRDLHAAEGEVEAWPDAVATPLAVDVIVDALFGTGLRRPLATALGLGWLVPEPGESGARIVAVDLPSGLCSDSGRVLGGQMVRADLTVTFHAPRLGHFLAEGPSVCGDLVCRDIGLPPGPSAVRLIDRPGGLSKAAPGQRSGHKFAHGSALILSGGVGRGGAARLAARACLRVGAGLVTVGCPPAALIENATRLDAVMLRPIRDAEALATVLSDARLNAICLGPGLGTAPREAALVRAALEADRATVLDGDALSLLAMHKGLAGRLHGRCVLTPHDGEFGRLCPDLAQRLEDVPTAGPAFSRIDSARAAAERFGAVVVLKGPDTIVAAPDGRARLHAAVYERAAPWLATAGAGDVLSGLVAGLLARGFAPLDAACHAVWLHAEAARLFGPGLIAEDLPDMLPRVLAGLEA